MLVLIGGGSRSGKTRLAVQRARQAGPRRLYIATAELRDEEMRERAAAHRAERGAEFETIEEPLDVAGVLAGCGSKWDSIIVDCLTVWLSNMMLAGRDAAAGGERLVTAARSAGASVFLVTNEVGCGIVPENTLARRFRDRAGWLNQSAADAADEVWWTVFGCPLRVK